MEKVITIEDIIKKEKKIKEKEIKKKLEVESKKIRKNVNICCYSFMILFIIMILFMSFATKEPIFIILFGITFNGFIIYNLNCDRKNLIEVEISIKEDDLKNDLKSIIHKKIKKKFGAISKEEYIKFNHDYYIRPGYWDVFIKSKINSEIVEINKNYNIKYYIGLYNDQEMEISPDEYAKLKAAYNGNKFLKLPENFVLREE